MEGLSSASCVPEADPLENMNGWGSGADTLGLFPIDGFQMSKNEFLRRLPVSTADSFYNDIASLVAEMLCGSNGFRVILRACFYANQY